MGNRTTYQVLLIGTLVLLSGSAFSLSGAEFRQLTTGEFRVSTDKAPWGSTAFYDTALFLSEADFKPLATGGFGDSANSYSWGLTELNGDVYVSTGRHHYWGTMMAVTDLLGGGTSIGLGNFIEGPPGDWGDKEWADAHRAEIWRFRNGAWNRVHQSDTYFIPEAEAITNPTDPLGPGLWGHYPTAFAYRTLGNFDDHIYALGVGTWYPRIQNTSIIRSISGDPGTWEDVSGNLANTTNVRGFIEWRGHLYVAPAIPGDGSIGSIGSVVYRKSNDETGGVKWEIVSDVGFGDPRNEVVNYLQVFNDHLYASTANYDSGFQVWKTDGTIGSDGKLVWTPVIKDGYGDTWCQSGLHLEPFGDYLYVGTAVPIGMVLKDQQPVGSRGLDIIRVDKDDNAELVVGAYRPSDPPAGWPTSRVPSSRLSAGFGNPLNVYAWHMGVYKDMLVVGTFDMTGQLLFGIKEMILSAPATAMAMIMDLQPSTNSVPPEQLAMLQSLDLSSARWARKAIAIIDHLIENYGGGDLWKTRDGINWQPITLSGLQNWLNYGFRRVVPVQLDGEELLFLGTANPFTGVEGGGAEVWANMKDPVRGGQQWPEAWPWFR